MNRTILSTKQRNKIIELLSEKIDFEAPGFYRVQPDTDLIQILIDFHLKK